MTQRYKITITDSKNPGEDDEYPCDAIVGVAMNFKNSPQLLARYMNLWDGTATYDECQATELAALDLIVRNTKVDRNNFIHKLLKPVIAYLDEIKGKRVNEEDKNEEHVTH